MIDRIDTIRTVSAGAAVTRSAQGQRDATLMKTASQLEGLFVQQLYKAMRETVPQQEGAVSGGAGEDIFTGLLDQHLATETPKQWEQGLAQALYRQLNRAAAAAAVSDPTVTTPERATR